MTEGIDGRWGPVDATAWETTPCIAGRAATLQDVEAGLAVFYVEGPSEAFAMPLPCCAMQQFDDGSEADVVVIQAEIGPHNVVVGVRYLDGEQRGRR